MYADIHNFSCFPVGGPQPSQARANLESHRFGVGGSRAWGEEKDATAGVHRRWISRPTTSTATLGVLSYGRAKDIRRKARRWVSVDKQVDDGKVPLSSNRFGGCVGLKGRFAEAVRHPGSKELANAQQHDSTTTPNPPSLVGVYRKERATMHFGGDDHPRLSARRALGPGFRRDFLLSSYPTRLYERVSTKAFSKWLHLKLAALLSL